MGVDTRIRLPGDVRVRDVADVIGILAGRKVSWGGSGKSRWVEVEGVTVESAQGVPQCANIQITPGDGVRPDHIYVLYHFEDDEGNGRVLCPRSTPFWVAVGKRLVQFFGGTVDYQDCDDVEVDFKADKPRSRNNPSDGKPWDDFQAEKAAIVPLTKEDVETCRKYTVC